MTDSKLKLRRGTPVMVMTDRHPDVMAGTVGKVDCWLEGGYGVTIDGTWAVAGGDRGQTVRERRTCWFDEEHVKPVSE